jgi:ABC-type nitrate/sulfonate/bicarbonate transport system substrate-binding protein
MAVAGCGFFPARAGAQALSVPLRIVGARNDSGAEIYYAQDLGMYADAGLDAHPEALNATATVAGAVLSGDVVIGGMTIPGLALAHERGLPLVIVAPSAIYSSAAPTAGIFVLKDSPYKKAADLNGKTLTTLDISNMGYYCAKAWIERRSSGSRCPKALRWPRCWRDASTRPKSANRPWTSPSTDPMHGCWHRAMTRSATSS